MTTQHKQTEVADTKITCITSLIAGGLAGVSVDIILFPLDTLKTRLQSKQGFIKSGGFSNLYKGIFPVFIGSAPTASLFFVTYEGIKNVTQHRIPEKYHSLLHMSAASLAEMVACLIRVPIEVLKQRKQALIFERKDISLKLLYCGYWSTVLRDMPFSLIQFPIWECFKRIWSLNVDRNIFPIESAICGAIAGGISAAITTPLDVIKTRIMLSHRNENASKLKILYVIQNVYKEKGLYGLFAGIGPRVMWITLGGFIFFGTYEGATVIVIEHLLPFSIFTKQPNKCY
ncbi:mitochondrial S-adenosylmethionine carrier protein [Megachile rotundata]|uniref:mitochondrial S-adenosylmethionine carrier protein n=1 Tax=Megachile rotundata TaxID=143995 RepID=UPI000258E847|nr:PREDICTED: S-adenosylmethionine mitochondrial carrier protein-like [Megachile rotundata]